MQARKRGRPSAAQRAAERAQQEREQKATDWLRHCEQQLAIALRDAPEAAARLHINRFVRRVLWAHFELLARGTDQWPPHIRPSEARADLEINEYGVAKHVDEVVDLVRARMEGLRG